MASALEASRAADGELEMLQALGHVTGNEPELLAAELEVTRAESTSRGYDAAGACLERSA